MRQILPSLSAILDRCTLMVWQHLFADQTVAIGQQMRVWIGRGFWQINRKDALVLPLPVSNTLLMLDLMRML